ncbi:MAG: GNAT family N-acetyltransferase, partial [Oscillospiraceae bacterium]|nr:GNAT family N-acetyltransferase [Oscillospiraceae bacterium]
MRSLAESEKDPELRKAYSEMLRGCLDFPESRKWYAAWDMELRDSPGTVAGDFCFKGPPEGGAVEVGYGLRAGFCGKGYMTEALKALCAWALAQPGVRRVEAETEPGNAASQAVLARAGFVPAGKIGKEGPRFVLRGAGKD